MTQHADKYSLQGRAPRFLAVRAWVCGVLAIYVYLHTRIPYTYVHGLVNCVDKVCLYTHKRPHTDRVSAN